jgi:hypothetical protein
MLVLGANFYATVVGNMSLLVSNLNATAARHNQRAEVIQEAMRYLNVSPKMQSRVQVMQPYSAICHCHRQVSSRQTLFQSLREMQSSDAQP